MLLCSAEIIKSDITITFPIYFFLLFLYIMSVSMTCCSTIIDLNVGYCEAEADVLYTGHTSY